MVYYKLHKSRKRQSAKWVWECGNGIPHLNPNSPCPTEKADRHRFVHNKKAKSGRALMMPPLQLYQTPCEILMATAVARQNKYIYRCKHI